MVYFITQPPMGEINLVNPVTCLYFDSFDALMDAYEVHNFHGSISISYQRH